jgi:hypothetical protein
VDEEFLQDVGNEWTNSLYKKSKFRGRILFSNSKLDLGLVLYFPFHGVCFTYLLSPKWSSHQTSSSSNQRHDIYFTLYLDEDTFKLSRDIFQILSVLVKSLASLFTNPSSVHHLPQEHCRPIFTVSRLLMQNLHYE